MTHRHDIDDRAKEKSASDNTRWKLLSHSKATIEVQIVCLIRHKR